MKRIYSKPMDKYEEELEAFLNKGKFVSMPKKEFEKHKAELQEAARRHIENRQSMTIRVKKHVIAKIKSKAQKKGLPYQTVVNIVLGQYADDKIQIVI